MLHVLKRHPIPVRAHFRHVLVLTYTAPADLLRPYLPPGLELDTYGDRGVLAIGMVQTQRLRPAVLPRWLGQDFFLAGYRIFAKFRTSQGRTLRGLRILLSETDRALMVCSGNLLTHYNYRLADVQVDEREKMLRIDVRSRDGRADLSVAADLAEYDDCLPSGSPFQSLHDARRFAGPLPYTFDYEKETGSIVVIKGVRQGWKPRLVRVEVSENSFLRFPPLEGARVELAGAFYVSDVEYLWERGRLERTGGEAA